MSSRVQIGATYGRWRVVRYLAPTQRSGEPYRRARVLCTCACGHERAIHECDLRGGRTKGCRSRTCRVNWERAQAYQAAVEATLATLGRGAQ